MNVTAESSSPKSIQCPRCSSTVDPHKLLSGVEFKIFLLYARGLCNKEIAHQLNMSVKTVSTHHCRFMKKMEMSRTYDIIRYCMDHHLID